MRFGVMVEGQENLSWERWRRIATLADDLGYDSLWRSDHLFSWTGNPSQDAIDAFASFVFAAEVTKRVRFGPLVTPVTFRHPSHIARLAAHVDALSGGRFVLGIGAGWNEAEHAALGFDFPPVGERFDRLEEAIEVCRALWGPDPANFEGRYYRLREAYANPKPPRGAVRLLVGGGGERRTLPLAARYADEWNVPSQTPEAFRAKREILAGHAQANGRRIEDIHCSVMVGYLAGRDARELRAHLERIPGNAPGSGRDPDRTIEGLRRRAWVTGSPAELVDQLGRYEEAGADEILLHHHAVDPTEARDVLELVAAEVVPQLRR